MPALAQRFDVALCGFVQPHVVIHGWGQHYSPGERQVNRAKKIIGNSVAELGEQVGRSGGDHKQIVILRYANVLDGAGKRLLRSPRRKHSRDDLAAGERSEGERPYELL